MARRPHRCPACQQPVPESDARRKGRPPARRRSAKERARYDARRFVRLAVKAGVLVKTPCLRMGEGFCSGPVEGHHYRGYAPAHWLDVQWLCRTHHRIADQESHE